MTEPNSIDRAALNVAVTGLQRRFADTLAAIAGDQQRIANILARLDVPADERRRFEDRAWHTVWLHQWRGITRHMTTEQRELAADAVERHWAVMEADDPDLTHDASADGLRWWRS